MTDREKLIELLGWKYNCVDRNRCLNEQADYLIANGVIVSPCKVGDTVYTSYDHLSHKQTNEILECKVVFIGFGEGYSYINLEDNYGHLHSMSFGIFDKTVSLTREGVEAKLRKIGEDNA